MVKLFKTSKIKRMLNKKVFKKKFGCSKSNLMKRNTNFREWSYRFKTVKIICRTDPALIEMRLVISRISDKIISRGL